MKVVVGMLIVLPPGGDLNDERATFVKLDEEGGGGFVAVEQFGSDGSMTIRIDPEEWPALRSAINRMMKVAK